MAREEIEAVLNRLGRSGEDSLKGARNRVENLASRLDVLSPLAVLSRGYSITMRWDDRAVISDARTVDTGEPVRVRLHQGELECRVTGKHEPEESTGG
jgi:exodeoxyribonuclease VII large subunit